MKRAVRSLIRVIAAALIVFGGMQMGLEFFRVRLNEEGMRWGQLISGSLLIAGGAVLFATSAKLAEMFTDDLED
jgi:hypothetical protein